MRLSIGEIADCLGLAQPDNAGVLVTSVATDNRQIHPGGLFVCIPGSRVDGHDFAQQAEQQGAVLILAQKILPELNIPVLVVEDTVKALGRIAALWRDTIRARGQGKVIAVTGTCGKTTVKEVLAQVLSVAGKTAKTTLNHNNQIGMPCDFLNCDGDEDFFVMEAGISHEGDMDELGSILRPDVALIVNVGEGHTEGLGQKGVAWHKTRLLAHLAPGGTALVSTDYPELVQEARAFAPAIQYFSMHNPQCPNRASYVGPTGDGEQGQYKVHLASTECDITAPFHGEYGAENVIAVTSCATLLGLTWAQIQQGFASITLPPQRFRHLQAGDWTVLDDTYNANPLSMRRMLNAAALRKDGKELVLVLGAMGELGEQAEALHEALGEDVATTGARVLFWKGPFAEAVHRGMKRGMGRGVVKSTIPFVVVDDAESLVTAWQAKDGPVAGLQTGCILFKGSRSNHLETFLQAFVNMVQGTDSSTTGGAHVL